MQLLTQKAQKNETTAEFHFTNFSVLGLYLLCIPQSI